LRTNIKAVLLIYASKIDSRLQPTAAGQSSNFNFLITSKLPSCHD